MDEGDLGECAGLPVSERRGAQVCCHESMAKASPLTHRDSLATPPSRPRWCMRVVQQGVL